MRKGSFTPGWIKPGVSAAACAKKCARSSTKIRKASPCKSWPVGTGMKKSGCRVPRAGFSHYWPNRSSDGAEWSSEPGSTKIGRSCTATRKAWTDWLHSGAANTCKAGSGRHSGRQGHSCNRAAKYYSPGHPCQIAGLHRFLGKEYGNLFTIDIVCHGVPSPGVWKKYVERLVADLPPEGRLDGIYFRDKCTGWKEFSFSAHLSSPEKTALYTEKFYRNMYMRGFLANLYLRPSCYRCPSKSGKSGADITLADFWGIERIMPRLDDDKGTGLVLVNTAKGKCLYNKLPIISQEVKYEQALKGNHVIETSVPVPPQREIFFDSFGKEDFFRLTDRLTRVALRTRLRRAAGRLIKLLR